MNGLMWIRCVKNRFVRILSWVKALAVAPLNEKVLAFLDRACAMACITCDVELNTQHAARLKRLVLDPHMKQRCIHDTI
jgi:hypothetical protein